MSEHCFRLITLGRLTLLRPDGAEDESLGRRRRKLALLAVLALASRPLARDVLIGMFWGEQDEERARHSLSDALSHARRVLGRDALTMHHSDVALAEDAPLCIDARELAEAAKKGNHGLVVSLYGGGFLAQTYAASHAQYQQWVDREHDRLERLFVKSCAHECNRLAREKQFDACAALAARWLDAEPLSGDAGVALLGSLAASGTKEALGRAMHAYRRLSLRLRKELDASPDARLSALAASIGERLGPGDPAREQAAPEPPAPVATSSPVSIPMPVAPPPVSPARRDDFVSPALAAPAAPAAPAARMPARPAMSLRRAVAAHRRATGVVVGAAAIVAAAWAAGYTRPRPALTHPGTRTIAVLPFRVAAADSSLRYLSEGMVDLLDAKLTGEVGPRAVDTRAVMSAWHRAAAARSVDLASDAARRLAADLGAEQLLIGNIVGTPERLVLSASVRSVASGRVRAQVTVQGSVDTLPALIDRMLVGLLAVEETGRRLGDLTSTSLPALKAYLAGRVAYRDGRRADAAEHYRRALDLDRSFALAELGLAAVGEWTAGRMLDRSEERAATLRSRLGARDAAFFAGYVGTPYPTLRSGARELSDWEHAVRVAPDSPESWYELGDRFFHVGAALGVSGAERKAAAAFSQALALDSSFVMPLAHLLEVAARERDTSRLRTVASLYLARDSISPTADYLRWRVAAALGNVRALVALRARIPAMSEASLERIVGAEQLDGDSLVLADAAAAELVARAATTRDRVAAYTSAHQLALNRGRPSAALATLRLFREVEPTPVAFFYGSLGVDQLAVTDALFGDGDSSAALAAARLLERRAAAPDSPDPLVRARQYTDLCTLELWRIGRGSSASTARTISRLRRAQREGGSVEAWSTVVCVPMLDALRRVTREHPQARDAVEQFDAVMTTWPAGYGAEFANLVVARLRVAQGDTAAALAALRRRPLYWELGPRYLSTFLREEGRLAALTGDRLGARRAYSRYLALRSASEPALRGEVDRAREALRGLR